MLLVYLGMRCSLKLLYSEKKFIYLTSYGGGEPQRPTSLAEIL